MPLARDGGAGRTERQSSRSNLAERAHGNDISAWTDGLGVSVGQTVPGRHQVVHGLDEGDELASGLRGDLRTLFSSLAQRFSEPNLSFFRARCCRQVVPPPEVKSQEKPSRCRCWTAAGIDVKGNSRHTDEGWLMKFKPRTWEALAAFSSTPPRCWRRKCARQSMFLLRAWD